MTTPEQLADWELGWRGSAVNADLAERERVFPPGLLDAPDLHFLIGSQHGVPVASGALNRTGDVVGLSNVFSVPDDVGPLFSGCVRAARSAEQDVFGLVEFGREVGRAAGVSG